MTAKFTIAEGRRKWAIEMAMQIHNGTQRNSGKIIEDADKFVAFVEGRRTPPVGK